MWNILCARRVEAARALAPLTDRVDSLAGCRWAAWESGAMSINLALGFQKLAARRSKLGSRRSLLDEIRAAVRRNLDRARRRLQWSDWFRAHSITEPRPVEMGAPLEGPSADEDPPELPG